MVPQDHVGTNLVLACTLLHNICHNLGEYVMCDRLRLASDEVPMCTSD
jgi:hypothetical protein